jgi:phenylacetate-coenzyme A ligase PaaK-like adenylate-forming protein
MTAADRYYDSLETRDETQRTQEQFRVLADHLSHARKNSEYYSNILADVNVQSINTYSDLAALPVTRKSDLMAQQKKTPPFGGLNAEPLEEVANVFMSPGPIYEPGQDVKDYFRMGRAMWAAGFRPGYLVHNTFSYHMTPAGMMMESGARAIGCPVFPAGVGNTELQLQAISELRPRAYVGTPSFLRILLEKGREAGLDMSSFVHASVGGEALPPSLRTTLIELGMASVVQSYGTADVGLIAYESDAMEGMIIDEGVIVEIVRPGTGDPVAPGEVGEVLVTCFNKTYPLIRFATGDMSAILEGQSPCGRTNTRIKGWMGRADQRAKVKGMFVDPSQVVAVHKRHGEIDKVRLVVSSDNNIDVMTLQCEMSVEGNVELRADIEESIENLCKVRGNVEFVTPGSIANDGKVIDDIRTYE